MVKKMIKKGFVGLIVVFMVAGLAACGQKEAEATGPEEAVEAVEEQLQFADTTVEIEDDLITVTLPDLWGVRAAEEISVSLPYTEWSRSIEILPPPAEKANAKVTVGRTENRRPLTMEQFDGIVESRAETLLPHAAEESLKSTYVQLDNGYGKHFTFTDASLVGEDIPANEYLYVTTYYITNNDGYLIYATLLCDDQEGEVLETMLNIISSIKAAFGETPPPDSAKPDMLSDTILMEFIDLFDGYELSVDDNPLLGIYETESGANMVLMPGGGYLWQDLGETAEFIEGEYRIFLGAIGDSGEIVTETETGPVFTVIIVFSDKVSFTVQVFDDQGGDVFYITDIMNDFWFEAKWVVGLSL